MNMRISITISDPWELGEATKWQPLCGNLLQTRDEGRGLIKLDDAVSYGGSIWHFAIASPRRRGDEVGALQTGKKVAATFIGISDEQAGSADAFDTHDWRGGLAFMGDIEPA